MQLIIRFTSEEKINLPIAYRHAVQSMIYNSLRSCPEYSAFLHDEGNKIDENTTFKLFTFGQLEGDYSIINKRIVFTNEITLQIRCIDPFMCQLLSDGFRPASSHRLLGNNITVQNCTLQNYIVFYNSIKIKMLSPITVLTKTPDNHTVFFSPQEDRFYEKVTENALRKWISRFGSDSGFELTVTPCNCEYRKNVTKFKDIYINAWYGEFMLNGNPKTLDFLYNVGIGNKNSQGFGMFEII